MDSQQCTFMSNSLVFRATETCQLAHVAWVHPEMCCNIHWCVWNPFERRVLYTNIKNSLTYSTRDLVRIVSKLNHKHLKLSKVPQVKRQNPGRQQPKRRGEKREREETERRQERRPNGVSWCHVEYPSPKKSYCLFVDVVSTSKLVRMFVLSNVTGNLRYRYEVTTTQRVWCNELAVSRIVSRYI